MHFNSAVFSRDRMLRYRRSKLRIGEGLHEAMDGVEAKILQVDCKCFDSKISTSVLAQNLAGLNS